MWVTGVDEKSVTAAYVTVSFDAPCVPERSNPFRLFYFGVWCERVPLLMKSDEYNAASFALTVNLQTLTECVIIH